MPAHGEVGKRCHSRYHAGLQCSVEQCLIFRFSGQSCVKVHRSNIWEDVKNHCCFDCSTRSRQICSVRSGNGCCDRVWVRFWSWFVTLKPIRKRLFQTFHLRMIREIHEKHSFKLVMHSLKLSNSCLSYMYNFYNSLKAHSHPLNDVILRRRDNYGTTTM